MMVNDAAFRAHSQFLVTQRIASPLRTLLLALGCPTIVGSAAVAASVALAGPTNNVGALGDQISIPYEQFTLANGLRVLVHTDRKAPVVAISVWYDVGSKDEPTSKTGFAHLFEHLMFSGSENADDDFFEPLQQVGATSYNGTTSYDRTVYYETVPTGALPLALYLESDRMGHLLGAVTQQKLDSQRGVVQNELRQNFLNRPFGTVSFRQIAALFPVGHPYGHDPIGSMADLDAASLDDVRGWFKKHYGPNNAVIALAGDIDPTTAKSLMQKYFGDIPAGPKTHHPTVTVPTLRVRKDEVMTDQVSTTRLYRTWAVPGLNDADAVTLDIGASVLGGLASSRLDNLLVKKEQLAVRVTAGVDSLAQVGMFKVTADVKPGVDPEIVGKRLDAIIADLVKNGLTAAEVNRVATQNAASTVKALESVGGKASILAQGLLYSNDADKYAKDLAAYAASTPKQVRGALAKWLNRPVYALTVNPGPREPYYEAHTAKAGSVPPKTKLTMVRRDQAPGVGEIASLTFSKVTHAQLSNGIEVIYAQRGAVPTTQIALNFDAGIAADPSDKQGIANLTTALLKEGTTGLNSIQIAERQEELGAAIWAGSSLDRTAVNLSALSANLGRSLDLFANVALHPAFAADEIERVQGQILAALGSEKTDPESLATQALTPAIYGTDHPYAHRGRGTEASVKAITRDGLLAFHSAWFRPEKAKLFAVSDLPLSQLQPLLEERFGKWSGEGTTGTKSIDAPIPTPRPRILLVDRKDSPQSLVYAGQVLGKTGKDDVLDLEAAAQVVGGSFLSRINMDIRETKGWSYGVRGGLTLNEGRLSYWISAPVQADQTGPAIASMLDDYRAFLTDKGVTVEELERMQNGNIRELPGAFETARSVLGVMQENEVLSRPDDYIQALPHRIHGQSAAGLDAAVRANIDPARFVWVVVGDAAKVQPQLERLGLPVEMVNAD